MTLKSKIFSSFLKYIFILSLILPSVWWVQIPNGFWILNIRVVHSNYNGTVLCYLRYDYSYLPLCSIRTHLSSEALFCLPFTSFTSCSLCSKRARLAALSSLHQLSPFIYRVRESSADSTRDLRNGNRKVLVQVLFTPCGVTSVFPFSSSSFDPVWPWSTLHLPHVGSLLTGCLEPIEQPWNSVLWCRVRNTIHENVVYRVSWISIHTRFPNLNTR